MYSLPKVHIQPRHFQLIVIHAYSKLYCVKETDKFFRMSHLRVSPYSLPCKNLPNIKRLCKSSTKFRSGFYYFPSIAFVPELVKGGCMDWIYMLKVSFWNKSNFIWKFTVNVLFNRNWICHWYDKLTCLEHPAFIYSFKEQEFPNGS